MAFTSCQFFHILCRRLSSHSRFLRHVIHQIMDMKYISTGKYAWHAGLQMIVDLRTGCNTADVCAKSSGQLIFRNQADG